MSQPTSAMQERGEAAFAICEAAALAARTQAMLEALRSRLDAFAQQPGATRSLSGVELEQLSAMGEEVAELASQLGLIVDGLPLEPLAVEERDIAEAARAALADGIVDHRRALTAAAFLTADRGFPALADALVDSDGHAYWTAQVADVLAAFKDVDDPRARQTAALAGVSHTARFCELEPERVRELAQVLRQLATR